MNATSQCIGEGVQTEIRECPYCHGMFTPKRRWSAFCSAKCRDGYEADIGATGTIASVRKLQKGVSVVIHLKGPAAERALNLTPRELVRLVRRP